MSKFQKIKTHMAVVVDQYGGVEGIITFEDVIKQLVGNVYDENDVEKPKDIIYIEKNKWKVNPDISVNVMFREIAKKASIDLEQNNTVGGWILENLAKLPKSGDWFVYKNFKIMVEKMHENRIIEVLVEKLEEFEKN